MKVNILRNNKGNALLLVILTITLITVVGVGLLKITSNTNKMTVSEREDQTIFYFAEAGVNLEKTKVAKVVRDLDVEIKDEFNNLNMDEQNQILTENGSIENYYYKQISEKFCEKYKATYSTEECASTYNLTDQFSKHPKTDTKVSAKDDGKIIIDSTGYFDGEQSKARKVRQELKLNTRFQMNNSPTGDDETGGSGGNTGGNEGSSGIFEGFAVITKGNIEGESGTTIKGTAGTMNGEITTYKLENITGKYVTNKLNIPESWYSDTQKKEFQNKIQSPSSYFQEASTDFNKYFLPDFPNDKFEFGESLVYLENLKATLSDPTKEGYVINNGNLSVASGQFLKTPTIKLTGDSKLNSLKITGNGEINIDIGSNNIDLYVDELNLNGKINIIGTGTLNIYAKRISNIGSSSAINTNIDPSTNKVRSPINFNLFYNGEGNLSFTGGAQINGSFYVGNTKSELTLGGGFTFKGNIFSYGPKITITGGGTSEGQWIVAPNAYVELSQGGQVKGVVVADTVKLKGGTSITYSVPIVPNPAIPTTGKFVLETDTSDPLFSETLIEVDKDK